jgi:hypothetical protein
LVIRVLTGLLSLRHSADGYLRNSVRTSYF